MFWSLEIIRRVLRAERPKDMVRCRKVLLRRTAQDWRQRSQGGRRPEIWTEEDGARPKPTVGRGGGSRWERCSGGLVNRPWGWRAMKGMGAKETFRKRFRAGVPGWVSWLSIQLLISAQVLISWS